MKATRKQAVSAAKQLGILLGKQGLSIALWHFAINVELEHASLLAELGVTTPNEYVLFAGKIVIAHLLEFPDYYQRLKIMERNAEKFWKNKVLPNLFKIN